ncbi:ribbon-helix-helix domain-containing protein [Mesorhizobium sp. Z1-4]|uniref:ribbon-helix-helix domain-containing protein n=1 Tax=Mesorhizobium sp. Z1-4 TaxID=2448478 RepID=UPI000FD7E644|nr:ribbon-helix-helix domain-containing protein [Mesorhizobium sp. Z1-4]
MKPIDLDTDAEEFDGSALLFRAVTARGKRRGIRLEKIFWEALSEAAKAEGRALSEVVGAAHDSLPESGNLASALRVIGTHWMRARLRQLEHATVPENVFALVQASPSPAFALLDDKRIVHYNLPFLHFVQASFVGVEQAELMRGLRLSLDMQLEDVLNKLKDDPKTPVNTGFALGVVGRRVRGQLKAALAPTPDQSMVVAFVTHP